ncbi:MAG: hypothetical protein ACRDNI_00770 [Gaiellaceae bacterium]
MKRVPAVLLVGVLAAALLVPAAAAKPGNGNGKGHGPPATASGGGGPKAKGKPAWAGTGQAKKAEKAAQKQERRAARETAQEEGEDAPKHDNPAWVCKFEQEQMGAEAFADEYGSNENQANAFGKCVSREAHTRDGVTDGEEADTPESGDEMPSAPDGTDDESREGVDTLAALRAFFRSLMQFVL